MTPGLKRMLAAAGSLGPAMATIQIPRAHCSTARQELVRLLDARGATRWRCWSRADTQIKKKKAKCRNSGLSQRVKNSGNSNP